MLASRLLCGVERQKAPLVRLEYEYNMKKINLHAHSTWSDGSGTIVEMTQAYEQLGFAASVITDHDYMIKNQSAILDQREEIKALNAAGTFAIPIIQGCEITLHYEEEAVLFGQEAIDHWFSLSQRIYRPGMFDQFEHALIWVHPRLSSKYTVLDDDRFLSGFHGFEIENWGKPVFADEDGNEDIDRINEIKEMIQYQPYRNSDAHSVNMLEWSYNTIEQAIQNEDDLIRWIRSRRL
jgi:hypothetical protein